jgi:hypothetical protein
MTHAEQTLPGRAAWNHEIQREVSCIRDAATRFVIEHGTDTYVTPAGHLRVARVSGIVMLLSATRYDVHHRGIDPMFGLDVWNSGKVLDLEWRIDGALEIRSFRRGDWIQLVLGAAAASFISASRH